MGKTRKIDFSAKRLIALAEKYYGEGDYKSALRFTFREIEEYGETYESLARLCDVYENLGLNSTALKYWFRCLDICDESDKADVYEALAVNYLNVGKEAAAAFYYNSLIDADDDISDDMKLEIAEAFAEKPEKPFKISYPPRLADYKKEIDVASKALKNGDCKTTIETLERVQKGAKEYPLAQEMLSLACVLSGDLTRAKEICDEILKGNPNSVRALATAAAIYLESKQTKKSKEIAERLSRIKTDDEDEIYKIATVCCENGLDKEAYERFAYLESQSPFDGRLLYFKGVSAYKSGLIEKAINAFSDLCTVYPEAAVVRYYLEEMRKIRDDVKNGKSVEPLDINYFYQIPQGERERRVRFLAGAEKVSRDDAEVLGAIAENTGLLAWCFDERDGMDYELQYAACLVANRARRDEFLREVLLDNEAIDLLKLEILRFLYERNENRVIGVVLYDVYRELEILPIKIGRKNRKKFLEAYARSASKFALVNDKYASILKTSAETLYRALEEFERLEQADNVDECACAIYMLSDLKEWGKNLDKVASAFDANPDRVRVLLTAVACYRQSDRDLELF